MSTHTSAEPFQLDHIAIAVPDVSTAVPVVVGRLGGRRHLAGPGIGFRFWQWKFQREGKIELLQPDGAPGGFLHRFLQSRGPGVHHVTLKVSDIDAAMGRASSAGYEIVGYNDDLPGWKEAFLHPKQAQGIVIQLAQSSPELEAAELEARDAWPFPPEPTDRPEPVDVIGLRLAARSAAQARKQWAETLGGHCTANGRALVFRWPVSPLCIIVRVDPDATEGPLGVELAPRPDIELPSGRDARTGTSFLAGASAESI